jgi:hypothetical protein|tara:strand:+ start:44 stop:427 length:384 start_codon:yes stop_codon:yes gene_type:complete
MVRPKKITNRNVNVPPAAINTQDNTRGIISGLTSSTTYGEGKELKEQVAATGGLPKVSDLPQSQTPRQATPKIDVFSGTKRPTEPVTSGLPFGPGVGTPEPLENTNDIIYEMYRLTGDSYLLNLIDQ